MGEDLAGLTHRFPNDHKTQTTLSSQQLDLQKTSGAAIHSLISHHSLMSVELLLKTNSQHEEQDVSFKDCDLKSLSPAKFATPEYVF